MIAAEALRMSAAVGRADHVAAVRITGGGAFNVLNRLSPRELFVRDGQILHTLLLREDARPLADLYVCADDEDFILLAEGLSGPALAEHVRAHAGANQIDVIDLTRDHAMISLDGPYAWEVFAELAGPEVIGLPYMSFFHGDGMTSFRVGKTGEYGYCLMVPRERVSSLYATLLDRGAAFDVAEADLAALDQCALENWFFNVRREGATDASPVELQLQWRVSYKRTFIGSEALARRRAEATRRLLMCVSSRELVMGAPVTHDGHTIGTIVNAGFSHTRGDWVATALVDRAYSHAGIAAYTSGDSPLRTLAAPALNNRSLYVNAQKHSYHTRHEAKFPPLVLPETLCGSPTER
ncbi:MAG: aminomethyltransferase family protein [Deltaproteobacteria bacterium]|nr:aminomethyltransferase family protein [Deltaproteobacteria bacterium]